MPGNADRHRQDRHSAVVHHQLPVCAPQDRKAYLLHTDGAGDGEGRQSSGCRLLQLGVHI